MAKWFVNRINLKRMELMSDIFEDIFDESEALASVDTGAGKTLSTLVRELRNVEQQIEEAENH